MKQRIIQPQQGYQTKILQTPADIAIGGGAAGVGKTFSMLLEPLRYKEVEGFGATIFRKNSTHITSEGGLWDESMGLYPGFGGDPVESRLLWKFGKKSKVAFRHMEYEKDKHNWQGSQIPLIGWDELTHFTWSQFSYMFSRNRTDCGVKPYIRCTTNPDPDSWVAEFIDWWICDDKDSDSYGLPIPERDGLLRYFVRDGDEFIWADTVGELELLAPHLLSRDVLPVGKTARDMVRSVTFIAGSIYDNKELLNKDPGYLGSLMSLDEKERMKLLYGNWKAQSNDEDLIDAYTFEDMFNLEGVEGGDMYVTADIALEGSDRFVISVWSGYRVIDVVSMDKSDGKVVEMKLRSIMESYGVPNENLVYDADGVGGFLSGYFRGSIAFKNGSTPVSTGKNKRENYQNLKSQCYYLLAKDVKAGKVGIGEYAKRIKHGGKSTYDHLKSQRRALKKSVNEVSGKLGLIKKSEMKKICGESPDFWDCLAMRKVFDLPREEAKGKIMGFTRSKR